MRTRLTLIGAIVMAAALSSAASERTLTIDPAASSVAFVLEATGHDVEGSFRVEAGTLTFDDASGAMSGEVHVDAKSAKTGNGSRDKTMHGDVLESAKFPLFTFKANRIEGKVAAAGKSSVKLHGIISVHGAEHPFVMPAVVEVNGGKASATATFPIPFVEWGLHDPSIIFLRVAKSVQVTVTTSGTLSSAVHEAASR